MNGYSICDLFNGFSFQLCVDKGVVTKSAPLAVD